MTSQASGEKIKPAAVRYIKLGAGGAWEESCLKLGVLRFGFDSGNLEIAELCDKRDWKQLAERWFHGGTSRGVATRFANETRIFFDDPGNTLWVTFIGERLHYGFLEPGVPERVDDGSSIRRIAGGWSCKDINGEELTKTRLAGSITKLAAYRGTSCGVDVGAQLVARINGEKSPHVELAIRAHAELLQALVPIIQILGPKDFEVLVDLIFSNSGWRRMGTVGSTQKTLDIDMMLPSTGERAFVQVKCRTTAEEFEQYLEKFRSLDSYDHMFFVYHTGPTMRDSDAFVVGPEKLAAMVVDAGLTDWVIQKVL